MRLALLTRRFDPAGGGTERDLMVTAQRLEQAGHEVTIYAAEIRTPSEKWRVRPVGASGAGRVASFLRFAYSAAALARRDGADLVLSFARAVGADILRSGGGAHASYLRAARKWRGIVKASAMWLSPYHRAQMAVERRAFTGPSVKKAIAVSNLVRDDLIHQFTLEPQKVVTLYNGVDLERFRPADDPRLRENLRRSLGIDGSAPVVIFVGNGFARKGLGFMLRAWPRIKAAPYLLVVGGDRAAASYERGARRLGIDGRVRFLGPRPDVERLFSAADALALPSLFEPFGNVAMEAMAAGLPVLTSAQCGVTEVLPAEMREFTVQDPSDAAEVAARLVSLIEARGELVKPARATAELFTWERYGNELTRLLDSVERPGKAASVSPEPAREDCARAARDDDQRPAARNPSSIPR